MLRLQKRLIAVAVIVLLAISIVVVLLQAGRGPDDSGGGLDEVLLAYQDGGHMREISNSCKADVCDGKVVAAATKDEDAMTVQGVESWLFQKQGTQSKYGPERQGRLVTS